jgi:predicted nucleotidyltransferase
MQQFPMISSHRDEIEALCRRFHVERLELFGSATGADFDPERSDVDVLVRFSADYDFGPWMSRLQEFEEELAALFQRPVDVVLESALRNPWFRREAEKTRTLIYDASQDTQVASGRS